MKVLRIDAVFKVVEFQTSIPMLKKLTENGDIVVLRASLDNAAELLHQVAVAFNIAKTPRTTTDTALQDVLYSGFKMWNWNRYSPAPNIFCTEFAPPNQGEFEAMASKIAHLYGLEPEKFIVPA